MHQEVLLMVLLLWWWLLLLVVVVVLLLLMMVMTVVVGGGWEYGMKTKVGRLWLLLLQLQKGLAAAAAEVQRSHQCFFLPVAPTDHLVASFELLEEVGRLEVVRQVVVHPGNHLVDRLLPRLLRVLAGHDRLKKLP